MKRKIVEEFVPDFIQIPYQLVVDRDLKPIEKYLYGVICVYSNLKEKKCYASNTTLSKMLFTTPNNISKSLKKLQEKKYILVVYKDPESKNIRQEIVPLVDLKKGTKKGPMAIPITHSSLKSEAIRLRTGGIPNTHTPVRKYAQPENTVFSGSKEDKTIDNTELSQDHNLSRGIPITQQSSISNSNYIEHLSNSLIEAPSEPSILAYKPGEKFVDQVRGISRYGSMEEIPHKLVCDVITFFLPIFPDVFVSKNPFVLKTNHTAVKGLLMRLTPEEIKDVVDKYHAMASDKFRPETVTIYDFCYYKFPKIEAYVKKSAGGLWAQRSISTPEQAKVRKEQYSSVIEKNRERSRLAKEKWDAEHNQK